MPLPGSLAIICSWMCSSGCRRIIRRLTDLCGESPKMVKGRSANSITISDWRAAMRLPVRRKIGTLAQRQLLMWALSATKVSVLLSGGMFSSCR